MNPELGIIEGYYGKPWNWQERVETVEFLRQHGYTFFIYAPKFDTFLRERWSEEHPREEMDALEKFSAQCRTLGVRFGLGLSPLNIFPDFGASEKEKLKHKMAILDAIGLDDLALLFDDMHGDMDGLAEQQAEISHFVADRMEATRLIVCPTYYTDDIVLDRFFGQRPRNYLENFGSLLDPKINVFWTGEEVCAKEIGGAHLKRVADQLRRKPFLWDNYPVNDGPRMSQYLHLRAFTGRSHKNADHIAAHAINPALQPVLSRIPALTLAESYRAKNKYAYGVAFQKAAKKVLGKDLAARVQSDLLSLQDIGLDRLGERVRKLRERYAAVDHPGAREIVAWLDGRWRITPEQLGYV
jgi:hypothetical protein